jgi:hypothetical protein
MIVTPQSLYKRLIYTMDAENFFAWSQMIQLQVWAY